MSTFETIDSPGDDTLDQKSDDFSSIFMDCMTTINFKLLLFLFLVFVLVTSDVFVDKILSKCNGATENRNPTMKGTFIQGFVVVILYILLDLIIKLGYF